MIVIIILGCITLLCYIVEYIIISIVYKTQLITKGKIPFKIVSKICLIFFILFSTIMLSQILLSISNNNYSFKQMDEFNSEYSEYYTSINGVRSTDGQLGEENVQKLIHDIEEANGLYYADFYFLNEGYGIDENTVQIIYVNENFMHEIGVKGEIKPNDVFVPDTFEYKSEIENYIENENPDLIINYINTEAIDDDFPKQRENYVYVIVDPYITEVEQLALLNDYYLDKDLNQILVENNMEGITTTTTVEQKVNIYLEKRMVDIIIFITVIVIILLTYIIVFNYSFTNLLDRKKRYIFVSKISGHRILKILSIYIVYMIPAILFAVMFPKYTSALIILLIISIIIVVVKYMKVWNSINLSSENESEVCYKIREYN